MFTVMRFCWGALVVLACSSALTAPPPSSGGHDGCSHSVIIPCPNVTGEVLRFHLLKDDQPTCNYSCQSKQDGESCETKSNCSDVKEHRSKEGKFSGFLVTPSKTAVTYRCQATVKFPPPLTTTLGDPVILVLVEGHQCGGRHSRSTDDTRSSQRWIWIVAVALLSIYSLAVTMLASIFWVKLRREELQNDYTNTKPQKQRPKKKKGIQNPIPPHFDAPRLPKWEM